MDFFAEMLSVITCTAPRKQLLMTLPLGVLAPGLAFFAAFLLALWRSRWRELRTQARKSAGSERAPGRKRLLRCAHGQR